MNGVCVVIPARNEAMTIGRLVKESLKEADRVLVVDDSSKDRTRTIAKQAGAVVTDVPSTRNGMAGVYLHGLEMASKHMDLKRGGPKFEFIVEIDAGGSHDPKDIPRLIDAIKGGADIATSRRFGPGANYIGKPQRKLLSWFGTQAVNWLHGPDWYDATGGFVAYKQSALELLLKKPYKSRGHFYQSEMRLRAWGLGFQIEEVPITYRNGGSSLNWKSIAEAAKLVL